MPTAHRLDKMKLKIEVTPYYERLSKVKSRIVVQEGGTRSSKTYSTLQLFIVEACSGSKLIYDIIRETMPALRKSAMKDFIEILRTHNLYNENNHNKSENEYRLNGSTFNFYPASDSQKLRGRKRDKFLMNEANEQSLDTFRQLMFRTEKKGFLDYNPSEEDHWIYDHVITRDDCTVLHSTYKDNPFLSVDLVKEIERLEEDDEEYWKIYGLGIRGKRHGQIYSNWDVVDSFPTFVKEVVYGLDFGFNDPMTLSKIGRIENDLWIEELFYERGKTTGDLIKLLPSLIENNQSEIYCDTAEPDRIEEIYRAGYNAQPSEKSVIDGIDTVKRFKIHIVSSGVETIKDYKNYKWKVDKNGKTLDEPTHYFSHSPDRDRYAIFTHWGKDFRRVTSKDMRTVQMESLSTSRIKEY